METEEKRQNRPDVTSQGAGTPGEGQSNEEQQQPSKTIDAHHLQSSY